MSAAHIFHFNKSHATVAVGAGDGADGHPLTSVRRIYFTNTVPALGLSVIAVAPHSEKR